MEISTLEAGAALWGQSRSPIIIIPPKPSTDAVAAALALLIVAEASGKRAQVASSDFSLAPHHAFLPKSDAIRSDLNSLQGFIISVDTRTAPLETLSYDIQDHQLRIYLTPKNGHYRAEDVHASPGPFAYDAAIVLDTATLEAIGPLAANNREFFYHVPILNIDHRPTNARFGHVNLVDLAASSVSEIVFEFIKSIGYEHLNEQVATNLLAGIISKTKAFQSRAVTPRSLAIASHLISAGARRSDIIQHLYQTKTIAALKLWGLALSRIATNPDQFVVWASIPKDAAMTAGVSSDEALGVLDELMVNTPNAAFVCLFLEHQDGVVAHIVQQRSGPPPTLPPNFSSPSPNYFQANLGGALSEAEQQVLRALQA